MPQPSSASTSPPLPTPTSHSPSSIPASITPLSLPSEGIFDSFDQLYNACQQHARLAGYAFTTAKSEKRDRRVIKTLICKRGGRHRSTINEDLAIALVQVRVLKGKSYSNDCRPYFVVDCLAL
jgi:hypothetical protein